jgi:predicted 3-demethylubiquinone-9 3-methyltransferase (glyoxalase superfamily)
MRKMTPFLWYDGHIAEAMDLYRSVFPQSKVTNVRRGPDGSVMSATFELDGQSFIAFNGGPHLKLTPAVSMLVTCETQAEVDELWAKLIEGGQESHCGWLVDRFGLSWQIIPSILPRLLEDPDREKASRATNAMLKMQKIDIVALERAAAGES